MKMFFCSLMFAVALVTPNCVEKDSVEVTGSALGEWGMASGEVKFDGEKYTYVYGWEAELRLVLLIYKSNEYEDYPPRISRRGVEFLGELIVPHCSDAVVLGDKGEILYRDPRWAEIENFKPGSPQTESFVLDVLARALK